MTKPIVGIVAVSGFDGVGIGFVEDEALVPLLEVENQLLVGPDFFTFDAAHGETDFAAFKVGGFQERAWEFFGDFHVVCFQFVMAYLLPALPLLVVRTPFLL